MVERNGRRANDGDGARDYEKRVWGTYLHGIFDSPSFLRYFLNRLRARKGLQPISQTRGFNISSEVDRLAERVRASLDMDSIYQIIKSTKEIR